MFTVDATSPIGARLLQLAMTSATHMHRLDLFGHHAVLQLRQVRTEINSNPQSTDKLKSCIQDALQNMQGRHKTTTANPPISSGAADSYTNDHTTNIIAQM